MDLVFRCSAFILEFVIIKQTFLTSFKNRYFTFVIKATIITALNLINSKVIENPIIIIIVTSLIISKPVQNSIPFDFKVIM